MKLDPTVMRTMSGQDFRVLEAVEKGMMKHGNLVPSPLIASLASLRHGGTGKILNSLLRDKLLSHDQSCGYDGYRLTNAGYDILALYNLKRRKVIVAIGDRIGTGKESDIYLAVNPDGRQVVLKFHRLGRTSFRNVKKTRDYFQYQQNHKHGHRRSGGGTTPASGNNPAHSWLFLSRKSALKEFAFMKALYEVEYPTPEPIAHNRHVVAMSLVRGVPLYQVSARQLSSEQAASIFEQATSLAMQLATNGLVHCDLNEFNLLVDLSGMQQSKMSNEHDPYVRHSGMSVAAASTPGMLSARGPWEPEYLQQRRERDEEQLYATNHQNHNDHDIGSHHPDDDNDDNKATPTVEYLDDDRQQPKPIVTLIDFPQMVSTKHPNAKELYERDMKCLYKFFSHKLQFQIPENYSILDMDMNTDGYDRTATTAATATTGTKTTKKTTRNGSSSGKGNDKKDELMYSLTWEAVQERLAHLSLNNNNADDIDVLEEGDHEDDDDNDNDNDGTNNDDDDGNVTARTKKSSSKKKKKAICLASKSQLRLDEQLQASGYSEEGNNDDGDLERYYNEYNQNNNRKDENNDSDNENDESEDEGEEEEENEEKDDDNNNDDHFDDMASIATNLNDANDDNTNVIIMDDQSQFSLSSQSLSLRTMTREEMERQARARVQQHLNMQKKRGRQRGAFRKRNSNKAYGKGGKRVYNDAIQNHGGGGDGGW